jgi:ribonuclease P/MRP protein subunit POP5
MKKAEEEAIRRARLEVMRLKREGEEGGMEVLEAMFGGDDARDGTGNIGLGDVEEEEDEEDISDD